MSKPENDEIGVMLTAIFVLIAVIAFAGMVCYMLIALLPCGRLVEVFTALVTIIIAVAAIVILWPLISKL